MSNILGNLSTQPNVFSVRADEANLQGTYGDAARHFEESESWSAIERLSSSLESSCATGGDSEHYDREEWAAAPHRVRQKSDLSRNVVINTEVVEKSPRPCEQADTLTESTLLQIQSRQVNRGSTFSLLNTRGGKRAIASTFISQGIGSLSDYSFTKFLQLSRVAVITPQTAGIYLSVIAGLYLARIPANKLTQQFTNSWSTQVNNKFIENLVITHRGRLDVWSDDGRREDLIAACSLTTKAVLDQSVSQSLDTISSVVGVAFNSIQLTILLHPASGAAAFGCASLAAMYMWKTSKKSKMLDDESIEAQKKLDVLGKTAAENIILPAEQSFQIWKARNDKSKKAQLKADKKILRYEQYRDLIRDALLVLPMTVGLAYATMTNRISVNRVFENLPSTYHLMGNLRSIIISSKEFSGIKANLDYLNKCADGSSSTIWKERLRKLEEKEKSFTLTHDSSVVPLRDICQDPEKLMSPGRWTLMAPNRSGKSTFLMAAAMHFFFKRADDSDNNVYLVPANTNMATTVDEGDSTGGRKLQQLQDIDATISKNLKKQYIFLDEWNANLSSDNQAIIDGMISRWSTRHVVVEALNTRSF